MWTQFFLQNAQFAINVINGLVMFAICWLYLDAWMGRKTTKDFLKVLGFGLLSASFLIHSTTVESSIISGGLLLSANVSAALIALTRIPGYVLVIIGLALDPIQKKPSELKPESKPQSAMLIIPGVLVTLLSKALIAYPILCLIISLLYLRKATVGLERHFKRVALGFLILAMSEAFSTAALYRSTTNSDLFQLVAPFGIFWILQNIFVLLSAWALRKWVFGYLFTRLQTQLFMLFTILVMAIFLVTSVTFTGLLLRNLQEEDLNQIQTDVNVLNFALESKKGQTLSDAEVIAQNPQVITAISAKDGKTLSQITATYLVAKEESSLVIVDGNGQVIARGEDRERVGESISSDPLIKRALLGDAATSITSKDGVLAPEISVQGATPVKNGDKVIGAVLSGTLVDNAFVDSVKSATGLDSTVYGNDQISATTLITSASGARPLGVKEDNSDVKQTVLGNGKAFKGAVNILNVPYFAAYLPLKDVDQTTIGMLFVGRKQVGVIQAAGRSVELTFLVTTILLILSVIPSFLIAKYIADQEK